MLELKMKPDIENILRRKKLERIKRKMIAKGNSNTNKSCNK